MSSKAVSIPHEEPKQELEAAEQELGTIARRH